jgi:ABC-type transporter Mla subunit MlaD
MDEGRRNLWVGIFVLFGLLALGTLIVMFGQGPTAVMGRGMYGLKIHFDEVSDIREGNLVIVKGIVIGRVVGVGLMDPAQFDAGVIVNVAIQEEFQIPEGSRALSTEPVLGQGRPPIEILPGAADAPPLAAGATIEGTVVSAIDTIFPKGVVTTFDSTARQIGNAAEALTPVLEELRVLLEQRDPSAVDASATLEGNLSTAVARLDASLAHFNEVLGDPAVKSQLREAVANVHEMSEQGKRAMTSIEAASKDGQALIADTREFVSRADGAIGNVEDELRQTTMALRASLGRIDNLLDDFAAITQQVRQGDGNVGRLVMDDRLYESLLVTAQQLTLAVDDFRELIAEWREGGLRVGL